MVDVGDKPDTDRRAVARGLLRVSAETVTLVRDGRKRATSSPPRLSPGSWPRRRAS
jgi:hypothetical protein